MGFLDKLKEIGFGNTGRAGRMDSGATNFHQYQQEREGIEGKRGVSQALALAAEDGKPVSFQKMNDEKIHQKVLVKEISMIGLNAVMTIGNLHFI